MLETHIVNFSFDQHSLKIGWGDGHNSTFHYVWLRDNAPENRHANGQKLIETTSIPVDVTARSITVDQTVRIEWPDTSMVSEFELLATSPVTFRFQSDEADLSHESTIISTDVWGDVNGIAFNNRSMQALYLPPEKTKAFYAAYQTFGQMLEADTYKITVKLADGDLIPCDNERILHGRIGYNGAEQRHAQGCYADRDSLGPARK